MPRCFLRVGPVGADPPQLASVTLSPFALGMTGLSDSLATPLGADRPPSEVLPQLSAGMNSVIWLMVLGFLSGAGEGTDFPGSSG